MGRAVLDGAVVHIPDVKLDAEYNRSFGEALRIRSAVGVAMLREGRAVGAISVWRAESRPFTDAQISLLQTFADQAVIAIENVRLFKELQEKNRALTQAHAQVTESLEQQTATAEILRVISSSPTEVQPVFDAIVAAGRRLSGGLSCTLRLLEGEVFRLAAFTSTGPIGDEAMRSALPLPVGEPLVAQMMRTRAPVFVADTEIDPLANAFRERARARGFRSVINVPLLWKGHAMGVMNVTRQEPGMF